jgi:hypothetical protein
MIDDEIYIHFLEKGQIEYYIEMKKKENEYEFKTLRNLRKGESLGLY